MQASGRIGELRTTVVNHLRTLDVYIVIDQVSGVAQLCTYLARALDMARALDWGLMGHVISPMHSYAGMR